MAIDKIQSESINLTDDFAFTGTVTGAGGVNTPAFYANMSGTQTVSTSTHTTIAFATQILDTDNAYNTSTYKFTPQTAGYYQFFVNVRMDTIANTEVMMYIQDTNNSRSYVLTDIIATQWMCTGSRIIYANGSSDAFEAKIWQNSGSNKTITAPIEQSSWGAYKIIT